MAKSSFQRFVQAKSLAAATIAALAATSLLPAHPSFAAGTVRLVGYMDSVSSSDLHRMLVDPVLNIGATIGNSGGTIILYDLEKLERIDLPSQKSDVPIPGITADRAAMDLENHRVFFTPGHLSDLGYSGCAFGPDPRFGIGVFDLRSREWSTVSVRCTSYEGTVDGTDQFKVQGIHYDRHNDRLYVAGTPQAEWFSHANTGSAQVYTANRAGIGLLIRQMDPETGDVDWEIDLRGSGCDRMVNRVAGEDVGVFVARVGSSLISYCYGVQTSLQGDQGYAVKIPLENGRPVSSNGRPTIKLTPTLPNDLFPMLDPVSGTILLLTSASPNGDAVWVYDPEAERFVGVIASGISSVVNQSYTAAGLDVVSGRTYMLSAAGLLVADARHRPLPSGLNFKVPESAHKSGPVIAVAPKLQRLFMPVMGNKYAVFEDTIPKPPDPPREDVDAGTSNIAEVPGKTISTSSGASAGFGARLLYTGGITRAINNLDYTCFNDGLEQALRSRLGMPVLKDANGRCFADQLLTGGTRDLYLGPTQVQLGSQTGAVAYASGAAFSTADTASDRDLKRISSCFSDIHEDRFGTQPPAAYESVCEAVPFTSGFQGGTRGVDGNGSPIPGTSCADFGDAPDEEAQPSTPAYAALIGSSRVQCNAQTRAVTATASASAFAFPNTANPTVSVGRAWSTSSSRVTSEGVLTIIESVATGVKIGDYSIGRLSTLAITRAHGLPGTNGVDFHRVISDVHGPNSECHICDYDEVIAAMNDGLGLKLRVSQPAEQRLESPLGYQSFVVKDQAARESDRATNNDDTFAVPALQIEMYNDGHDGRNRLILQLAGVQSQSQYGRVALPELSQPTFEGPAAVEVIQSAVPPTVSPTQTPVPPTEAVSKVLSSPPEFIDDAVRLIIHNPREFVVLFVLWSLLAAPLYLGLRRRSLLREVR